MAVYRIRLDAQRHAAFLAQQRKDPITLEPLSAGMEIVVCARERLAFIAGNWAGQCPRCQCTDTLEAIPLDTLPVYIGRRPESVVSHRGQPRRGLRGIVIGTLAVAVVVCVCLVSTLLRPRDESSVQASPTAIQVARTSPMPTPRPLAVATTAPTQMPARPAVQPPKETPTVKFCSQQDFDLTRGVCTRESTAFAANSTSRVYAFVARADNYLVTWKSSAGLSFCTFRVTGKFAYCDTYPASNYAAFVGQVIQVVFEAEGTSGLSVTGVFSVR